MGIISGLTGRGPTPRSLLAATCLGLVLLIILSQTGFLRPLAYRLAREMARADLLRRVADWETITSEHFVVKFLPQDRDVAPLVLEAAEAAYGPVTRDLAYTPPGRTAVVIYPTREELNASFSWPAQESAMGVYWGGAIRVLSPKAWVEGRDLAEIAQVFRAMGPMTHEFTHLVLDYKTGGNYPRWFSEGLAQYEEVRQGGVLWNERTENLAGRHYSLAELDRFDELDQNLAYSDALSLVEYLVEVRGEEGLKKVIEALGKGASFSQALGAAGITSPAALEAGWKVAKR
ncbi:MAG: hypothetical protein PWQ41_880 [Bacillota bacterium]|nr:hypothetical protein [Bacillota bacterium]MDK2856341.1 hypothetical protein [Bacillota bacterium]MDK2925106.1 hypothetical protein [Bacillota bacterium]